MRLANCMRCSRLLSIPVAVQNKVTCQTCIISEIDYNEKQQEFNCEQCGETLLKSERKWCGACAQKIAKQFMAMRPG